MTQFRLQTLVIVTLIIIGGVAFGSFIYNDLLWENSLGHTSIDRLAVAVGQGACVSTFLALVYVAIHFLPRPRG